MKLHAPRPVKLFGEIDVTQSADYSQHPERETGGSRRRGEGCAQAASPACLNRRPAGCAQDEGVPLRLSAPSPAATRPVARAAFVNNQPRYPHRFARKPMETGARRRDVAMVAAIATRAADDKPPSAWRGVPATERVTAAGRRRCDASGAEE